ncbi:MAG: hypothetical protein CVV44_02810 [Spirochaetae bacterium HGW-Spirochaetae-1]|jgi:uncharacterized protein with HEPN domain|nr:MAG: hypothetical protein CVV44_02810 [Spirochaetae bacterium HGW-Spirochaetae-1]
MSRDQSLYIDDIILGIEAIMRFIVGSGYDEFIGDDKTYSAVIRKIEIIGEAAKNISSDVKDNNPHIPWSAMARMRDRLIHGYFGIDDEILWKTITGDLPGILDSMIDLRKRMS